MKIGYFLASEEWGPRDLVAPAVKAQEAGFNGLWISDHYHPWNDEQGHSPFVWSTIGAIAHATGGAMKVTTAVTCPTIRIRPAIIAQAAATSAVMLEGNCTVGPDAESVKLYRDQARNGQLVQGGLKVCWGAEESNAVKTVHRLWPNEALPGELAQILPTPKHFE
jgi:luciferase-like monooxygenase